MSKRKEDSHSRYRSRTIGFRCSPEENEQINLAVSISGMEKQEYIISKLLDRTITVQGSCRVHRAVYDRLTEVLEELKRIEAGNGIDGELMEDIGLIAGLVEKLYRKE